MTPNERIIVYGLLLWSFINQIWTLVRVEKLQLRIAEAELRAMEKERHS